MTIAKMRLNGLSFLPFHSPFGFFVYDVSRISLKFKAVFGILEKRNINDKSKTIVKQSTLALH